MINGDHMINDGLNDSCANNGQPTWTYNQGVRARRPDRAVQGDR